MLFFFGKKKSEDEVINNHNTEVERAYDEDDTSIRDRLLREYPSPESAIEDYRKGYIDDEKLKMRFSEEEIDLIHKEKEERDREDKEVPTGGFQ